jgi:hypothetical protein
LAAAGLAATAFGAGAAAFGAATFATTGFAALDFAAGFGLEATVAAAFAGVFVSDGGLAMCSPTPRLRRARVIRARDCFDSA